tara:strand:+ start:958 stop:1365 length:408 start_codon:yes stop_codon:yes gene_type:complete
MAYFAKLNSDNIVTDVNSVHNNVLKDADGVEQEALGITFLTEFSGSNLWKQTSYNTYGGVHTLGGTPFRKNYAGIGHIYDETRDAFYEPKPHASWILNEETCQWTAPSAMPDDGKQYAWNEATLSWNELPAYTDL